MLISSYSVKILHTWWSSIALHAPSDPTSLRGRNLNSLSNWTQLLFRVVFGSSTASRSPQRGEAGVGGLFLVLR